MTLTRNRRGGGCYCPSWSHLHTGTLPRPISFVCHSYENCRVCTPNCHSGRGVLPTSKRSAFKPSNDPLVPLQPKALGATMASARILYDPGKQLRSPRCLTILSGHREPFDDVPGYTPTQSGSQVVPGSSVLTRVSGFVLTNPEQSGPQQGGPSNPSVQDGAWARIRQGCW